MTITARFLSGIFLTTAIAACGAEGRQTPATSVVKALADPLETFNSKYLEIDEESGGPGDADVLRDTPPYKVPSPTPAPADDQWIDWSDLPTANHRLQDLNDPDSDRDPSSFPRSNECVADSKVLSKMDLTYVGVANNQEYAYLAVQRANNNGDAGYYWIFTKNAPRLAAGEAPCKAGEKRLVYDISPGDVLFSGHFQPSATPLLEAYTAIATRSDVGAVDAIDFKDATLWAKDNSSIEAVAVNERNINPGSWGSDGVSKQALSGGDLEPELFAEAAVRTAIFTGGSICGAKFYGSVITRSSGSGGTTPDLKDLAGPRQFNFGDVSASAKLTPSCDPRFGYDADLLGIDGQPVTGATCSWVFEDAAGNTVGTSSSCDGYLDITPGAYKGTVTATDPGTGCSGQATLDQIDVYAKIGVSADLTATCTSSFGYGATVTGGSAPGSAAVVWAFSGDSGGTPSPTSSTSLSGSVAVNPAAQSYTGTVTVTDPRTDLTCTATHADSATPYAPITVSLTPRALGNVCTSGDAAIYDAVVSGGNGSYSYGWTGWSCSGGSCTIDPSNDTFCANEQVYVTVSDTSLCPSAQSETETYTKTTTVTASNN